MKKNYVSADEASGGAMQENFIPELTALAMENIDFSDENVLGGAYTPYGATYTVGAIVAQTAGIPINSFYMSKDAANVGVYEGYLLPGQYSDVIACSSRQIDAFVKWIQKQDFYENTTIVIAGDHLTMDSEYIEKQDIADFDRRVYVTIINPAEGCEDSQYARQYTTMDMYPTTLAALGVEIEGNRLGLGVNLFSEEPTLYEKYGAEYVNNELLKKSGFYEDELLQQ